MVARTNNTVMTVGQVSDLTRKQMIGTRTLSSSSFFYEANDVLDDSKERERERDILQSFCGTVTYIQRINCSSKTS